MAMRHVLGSIIVLGFVAACSSAGDDAIAEPRVQPSSDNKPAPEAGSIDAGKSTASASCQPGTTRACYEGPADTRNVGICREGTQTCLSSGEFGVWGECEGDITPDDTGTGSCECTPEHVDAGLPDLSAQLCGGTHTECECGMAGGTLVDIGESCRICRFDAAACPESWQNYDNWRTTVDGKDCGIVEQIAPTGAGGAAEGCPPHVPAVKTSQGTFLLSCDRQNNYCCGSPPDPKALQTHGKPWSSHVADEKTFNQGVNVCGCACGSEHCQVKQLSCIAPTTQIGCS